ncbi:MAG: flagellar motor switch protein FliN [Candidatus Muirbacterium halophilum]|nr:flagellar motor switch protein FliN [Candidatus Muirbacterium halophilum]MCK9476069.1 flagellar motor switch protein FliN [Candidatus Muirbacterium halophilum]
MSDTLLTQDEIDALLTGASSGKSGGGDGGGNSKNDKFSPEELEALKEFFVLLSNGAASVLLTLSSDENAHCEFADLKTDKINNISNDVAGHSVMEMNFNEGFVFDSNVFISQEFIKSIASMMLGGAEVENLDPEFLSATEAFFDQILGSVVMLWKNRYDIAARYIPPKINAKGDINALGLEGDVVAVTFDLALSDSESSKLIILVKIEQAKEILSKIMKTSSKAQPIIPTKEVSSGELSQEEIDSMLSGTADSSLSEIEQDEEEFEEEYEEEYVAPRPKKKKRREPTPGVVAAKKIRNYKEDDVSSVEFADLEQEELVDLPSNIDLLLDVPLEITVELGRTRMLVKDILELGTGSVIELERLAGESIDVLVNGKLIAKGEVVVIDENFGIRITSIVSPNERLARLK